MSDAEAELNLVWWLFRHKGWKPSEYWDMPDGEKVLVSAMAALENGN